MGILLGVYVFTRDFIWVVFALLFLIGWLLDPESPKPSYLKKWDEWLLKNRPRRLSQEQESDEEAF